MATIGSKKRLSFGPLEADESVEADAHEEGFSNLDLNAVMAKCLHNAGLFFSYASEKDFIIWLKHVPLTTTYITREGQDRVKIVWIGRPPDEKVLSAPGIRASEVMLLFHTSQTVVIHAPRPLTSVPGRFKREVLPSPEHPEWLVISFPWRSKEEDVPVSIVFE